MIIDKRRQERVKVDADVYYLDAFQKYGPQRHHEKHEGQVVDICPDGICICTRHEFDRGSIMQFNINEYFKGTFTGIVKRCVKSSDDKYHVGLEVPFSDDSNMH